MVKKRTLLRPDTKPIATRRRNGQRGGRPRTNPVRVVIELLPAHLETLDRFRHARGEISRQRAIRTLIERAEEK
jgi:hypothetical protein